MGQWSLLRHGDYPRFTQPVTEAPARFPKFACHQWCSLHISNMLPAITMKWVHRSINQSYDFNFKIRKKSALQKVWKIAERKIVPTIIFLFSFFIFVKAVILVPILLCMLLLKYMTVFFLYVAYFIFIGCLSKYAIACLIIPYCWTFRVASIHSITKIAVVITLTLKVFSIPDYVFRGFPEMALTRSKNMSILWLLKYVPKCFPKKAVPIYNVISNISEDLIHCLFPSALWSKPPRIYTKMQL